MQLDQGGDSLAFSPDQSKLAMGTGHLTISLVDVTSGELLNDTQVPLPSDPNLRPLLPVSFTAVAFTPDGRNIVGAEEQGQLWVWNLNTGELELNAFATAYPRATLQLFPNNPNKVLIGKSIVSLSDKQVLRTLPSPTSFLSPDGNTILTSREYSGAGSFLVPIILDADTSEVVRELPLLESSGGEKVRNFFFNNNTNFFVEASKRTSSEIPLQDEVGDIPMSIYSLESRSELSRFVDSRGQDKIVVDAILFTPDGNKVAMVSGNIVNIYDLSDLETAIPNAQLYDN